MKPDFEKIAAAYVRGQSDVDVTLSDALRRAPLVALSDSDLSTICDQARAARLRIHAFKRATELPRVRKVLGILKGIAPDSVLDVGSGRGVFLWPLLDAFPDMPVTSVDRDLRQVGRVAAVRRGGLEQIATLACDATTLGFEGRSFDVVTLLEVIEHVPDYRCVLAEALRVARRFVVISVPSKTDDNPEHIHLFTAAQLERDLREAGAAQVSVDYVLNHILLVARCP